MSEYEPQVGDIAKFENKVVRTDGVYADLEGFGWLNRSYLTLVSRPEPTYTVELTEIQLSNLAFLAEQYGTTDVIFHAAKIMRETIA